MERVGCVVFPHFIDVAAEEGGEGVGLLREEDGRRDDAHRRISSSVGDAEVSPELVVLATTLLKAVADFLHGVAGHAGDFLGAAGEGLDLLVSGFAVEPQTIQVCLGIIAELTCQVEGCTLNGRALADVPGYNLNFSARTFVESTPDQGQGHRVISLSLFRLREEMRKKLGMREVLLSANFVRTALMCALHDTRRHLDTASSKTLHNIHLITGRGIEMLCV